jgi:hypothetical protein
VRPQQSKTRSRSARVIAVSVLCALLGLSTSSATLGDPGDVVLGSKAYGGPYSHGFGVERPSHIDFGTLGSSISNIRWSRWGAAAAMGWGKRPILRNKKPYGYYRHRVSVRLRVASLRLCNGKLAYRRLFVRTPKHPGGALGPWRPWSDGPLCT